MPKGLDEKQAERWVRDHWDELIDPNIQTHRLETCGSDLEWHRKCNRLNARATHPEPQGVRRARGRSGGQRYRSTKRSKRKNSGIDTITRRTP